MHLFTDPKSFHIVLRGNFHFGLLWILGHLCIDFTDIDATAISIDQDIFIITMCQPWAVEREREREREREKERESWGHANLIHLKS